MSWNDRGDEALAPTPRRNPTNERRESPGEWGILCREVISTAFALISLTSIKPNHPLRRSVPRSNTRRGRACVPLRLGYHRGGKVRLAPASSPKSLPSRVAKSSTCRSGRAGDEFVSPFARRGAVDVPLRLIPQHHPVSRFSGANVVEGGVYVLHRKGLGDGRDLVAGAEI